MTMKDELRYVLMVYGALYVMITGDQWMLK